MDDLDFEETKKTTPQDDLISNSDPKECKISIVHRLLRHFVADRQDTRLQIQL